MSSSMPYQCNHVHTIMYTCRLAVLKDKLKPLATLAQLYGGTAQRLQPPQNALSNGNSATPRDTLLQPTHAITQRYCRDDSSTQGQQQQQQRAAGANKSPPAQGQTSGQQQAHGQTRQSQQGPSASAAAIAAEFLQEIEALQQQMTDLHMSGFPDGETVTVCNKLRSLAEQFAATHTKLHLWAARAGDVHEQQQWRKELAEYRCLEYEDMLEAQHLLIRKNKNKLSGMFMLHGQ